MRQTFGDFLNQGEPSTPRGRGRGRGGGGRGARGSPFGGRGRGGGGARGGRGGGSSFSADYSNVGLDYDKVNTRAAGGYIRSDQYTAQVQPFGPGNRADGDSTRGRGRGGGPGGGGRGGGRGARGGFGYRGGAAGGAPGFARAPGSATASPGPSGAATPVTGGLGFHRSTMHARVAITASRVGADGVVTWGGGRAPLFVKAGELFKEGEVDVVKRDGDVLRVQVYPMDDPSAPQMTDLHDDAEIDIEDGESTEAILGLVEHAHEAHVTEAEEHVPAPHHERDQEEAESGSDAESQPESEAASESEEINEEDFARAADALFSDDTDEEDIDRGLIPDSVQPSPAIPTATLTVSSTIALDSDTHVAAVTTTTATTEATEIRARSPSTNASSDPAVQQTPERVLRKTPEPENDSPLFFIDTTGTGSHVQRWETNDEDSAAAGGDDTLFFVDTGADVSTSNDVPLYDTSTTILIGADRRAPRPIDDAEEAIVFRPRLIADPVPASASSSRPSRPQGSNFELTSVYVDPRVVLNRKDRKALKKSKRARNKKGKRGKHTDGMPREDSDLDWGSDGPPAPKVLDIEVNALGHALASTDLDFDEDVDPDIDMEAMARFANSSKDIGAFGGEAMVEMESDSDQWEDQESVKGKGKGKGKGKAASRRRQQDPFGLEISSSEDGDEGDDDDDDDEDLDETVDFEALAAAYDSDSDSEDDNALFTGHNAWKDDEDEDEEEEEEDEADWFARNLDNALNGGVMSAGRKERKAVFRSVHNGTFDEALPIAPAKKDKKGAHIPQALHDQWERDRARKADKKRQREMDRMLGLLIGNSKKGKKAGKAAAAARAHLVNASAAEVAELFDVTSDDGGWGVTTMPKHKGHMMKLLPRTLDEIDIDVQEFLEDNGRTTLALPSMDKELRKKVHMLAECYGLKSQSKGKGHSRYPILFKGKRSRLMNPDKLERLLAASRASGSAFYKALYQRGNNGGKKASTAARGTGGGASARAREGELVGEGAEKIGQDNVGHKLLSMMGWTEGSGIGRVGGLDAPVVAVVKNTKSGLGA